MQSRAGTQVCRSFDLAPPCGALIGSTVDQILLYCYHYDPKLARYSAAVLNMVRLGGAATVVLLSAFLAVMWRRDRRRDILRAAAAGIPLEPSGARRTG